MLLNDAVSTLAMRTEAREPSTAPRHTTLADSFAALNVHANADGDWAIANYKRTISDFCKSFAPQRLIEIGGGRDPLFDPQEIKNLGVEMTINDISSRELAVLPPGYRTACFDVAGNVSSFADRRNSFDFAFSRMVFEHVTDGQRAWANLYDLLAPGGVALTYIPTLFAFPFVANWLLPDKLAAAIVKTLYKNRTDDDDPVFPARYSWCFTDARLQKMLSAIGYREIFVQPFYGHGYYKSLPILHKMQTRFSGIARRRDWRAFTSFAYIAVRK
jgi:SAM-dependent methyltransferase